MKVFKSLMILFSLSLCLVLVFGCSDDDDDNGTGPINTDIPSELVGTWNWTSALLNGVPQSFAQVSLTDSSQAGSVTFYSNNTWSSAEYYNSVTVYSQQGNCSNSGHVLTLFTTMEQGMPVIPPDTSSTNWTVLGDNLILNDTAIIVNDTFILISSYTKQ